jgi:hypothetical protein
MTADPVVGPSGKTLRLDLKAELGPHAHVKVVYDARTCQHRLIVYCVACRSASMVSYHRHEIVALWGDHAGSERHARKSAVAEARAANHEGLFPEPQHAATAVVFEQPHGDEQ